MSCYYMTISSRYKAVQQKRYEPSEADDEYPISQCHFCSVCSGWTNRHFFIISQVDVNDNFLILIKHSIMTIFHIEA